MISTDKHCISDVFLNMYSRNQVFRLIFVSYVLTLLMVTLQNALVLLLNIDSRVGSTNSVGKHNVFDTLLPELGVSLDACNNNSHFTKYRPR